MRREDPCTGGVPIEKSPEEWEERCTISSGIGGDASVSGVDSHGHRRKKTGRAGHS